MLGAGKYLLLAGAALGLLGCVAPTGSAEAARASVKSQPGEHGLQISRVIDEQGRERREMLYIPRGIPRSLMEAIESRQPEKVLEMSQKMAETDFTAGMFGAKWVAANFPHSPVHGPVAWILVAEIYEKRQFGQLAFEAYQTVIDKWPGYPRRRELMERQMRIADRFLAGEKFKWKLPWQEAVYLPLPRWTTPTRTAGLYQKLVGSAPYSPMAAEAQFKSGEALRRELGILSTAVDKQMAIDAFQMAADRYGRREMATDVGGVGERLVTATEKANKVFTMLDTDKDGKLTRQSNPDIFDWQGFTVTEMADEAITKPEMIAALDRQEQMVAQGRYQIGQIYQSQASDGLYDQTVSEKSIRAYNLFLDTYAVKGGDSRYAPRDGFQSEWYNKSVSQAEFNIHKMRLEQARGNMATGDFYAKKRDWTAAMKHYGIVVQDMSKDVVQSLTPQRKALHDTANAQFAAMYSRRITDGLALHRTARVAETAGRYNIALEQYRRTQVNLGFPEAEIRQYAATPKAAEEVLQINVRVREDISRIESVLARIQNQP